jgi:hypothetical protein
VWEDVAINPEVHRWVEQYLSLDGVSKELVCICKKFPLRVLLSHYIHAKLPKLSTRLL